jgi:Prokaryotic cytochrome b561
MRSTVKFRCALCQINPGRVSMLRAIQAKEVRVWDPFVRVFHWSLPSAVLIAWATDEPLWLHNWLGYVAAILVVLRVIWGFVGTDRARFVNFVRGPRLVIDYLAGLVRLSSPRYLGHTAAAVGTGAAMASFSLARTARSSDSRYGCRLVRLAMRRTCGKSNGTSRSWGAASGRRLQQLIEPPEHLTKPRSCIQKVEEPQ